MYLHVLSCRSNWIAARHDMIKCLNLTPQFFSSQEAMSLWGQTPSSGVLQRRTGARFNAILPFYVKISWLTKHLPVRLCALSWQTVKLLWIGLQTRVDVVDPDPDLRKKHILAPSLMRRGDEAREGRFSVGWRETERQWRPRLKSEPTSELMSEKHVAVEGHWSPKTNGDLVRWTWA